MNHFRILIVEDDGRLAEELSEYLQGRGFSVLSAASPSQALQLTRAHDIDVALIDIKLPEYDGLQLLRFLKQEFPALQAIMMSGHGDMDTVIQALRQGAFDYLAKPFTPPELEAAVIRLQRYLASLRENRNLRQALSQVLSGGGGELLLGSSEPLRRVRERIDKAAGVEAAVIILGESGTGKELAARAIHYQGPRSGGPFVAVNCAALPQSTVESELFGHVRGAFTGATADRKGHIRSADGGTLFLDEIGELPLELQAKFLRVLETRTVRSLGSDREVPVDFRVICATNRPLTDMVREGRFREDLYYRLSVLEIVMPSLNQIPEDIPVLARHLWVTLSLRMGKPERNLPEGFLKYLRQRRYSGNVRELRNIVERALILGPEEVMANPEGQNSPSTDLDELNLRTQEVRLIRLALERTGGNHTRAAELLGISRQALLRRLAEMAPHS